MMSQYSIPLFLFASSSDMALLSQPPSSFNASGAWDDYELVFSSPVAYGAALEDTPSYPFTTLRAYWSAERSDFQTTTYSLDELNAHGGSYEHVADVALVASTPGAGVDAAALVPLRVAFDSSRADGESKRCQQPCHC